jgi:hypothetical protein
MPDLTLNLPEWSAIGRPTKHAIAGIYLFPCRTLDRPRQLPIGEENENRWCLWRPDQLGLDSRSIFEGALVEE